MIRLHVIVAIFIQSSTLTHCSVRDLLPMRPLTFSSYQASKYGGTVHGPVAWLHTVALVLLGRNTAAVGRCAAL